MRLGPRPAAVRILRLGATLCTPVICCRPTGGTVRWASSYRGAGTPASSTTLGRNRCYVPLHGCNDVGHMVTTVGRRHRDVFLPHGWHLNMGTIPIPHAPTDEQALYKEMRHHIHRLPPTMWYETAYQRDDFWRASLAWEHEARWVICNA
jgi:hypothetical protein